LDWLGARVGVDVPPLAKGNDRGPTATKKPIPRPAAPAPRPTVREGPVADPDRRIEIYTTVGNAARLKSPCHYLTNRGISHQTAVAAGVGLVTESYPVITRQLCEQFSLPNLKACGMFNAKDNLRIHKHRLLFPCWVNGEAMSMQARNIAWFDKASGPKELNLGPQLLPYNVDVLLEPQEEVY